VSEAGDGVLPGAKGAVVVASRRVSARRLAARLGLEDVVLAVAHGLGREEVVDAVARLAGPGADGVEHFALDLDALVA
jgi:hypothetical protein